MTGAGRLAEATQVCWCGRRVIARDHDDVAVWVIGHADTACPRVGQRRHPFMSSVHAGGKAGAKQAELQSTARHCDRHRSITS
jgi:hypothetical protein